MVDDACARLKLEQEQERKPEILKRILKRARAEFGGARRSGDYVKAKELSRKIIPQLEQDIEELEHSFDRREIDRNGKMLADWVSADAIITNVAQQTSLPVSQVVRQYQALTTFDMTALVKSPLDMSLPVKPESPPFICSSDWLNVVETIRVEMEAEDGYEKGWYYVQPMAFMRCSRGGKTRALTEIAHILRQEESSSDPVAVIFVSFSDETELLEEEQHDPPLQALLRRIAFAAYRDHQGNKPNFQEFHARGEFFDESLFTRWFGKGRIVLIIDDLNRLSALSDKQRRRDTRLFGEFLKRSFMSKKGRYHVFSSQDMSLILVFEDFIDSSNSNCHHLKVPELPLFTDVNTDLVGLNASQHLLYGAGEAVYCGLIPAMIYERARNMPVAGEREAAMKKLLDQSLDAEKVFRGIIGSLIHGSISSIPRPLRILLDSSRDPLDPFAPCDQNKIRWVPFHLQYVLEELHAHYGDQDRYAAAAMASLCAQLVASNERSGDAADGWEGLFVLMYLARSSGFPDDELVPNDWFADGSVSVKYNPYENTNRRLCECKSWNELKEGIRLSMDPTISIFYPLHAEFQGYDAVVVYSLNNKFFHRFGFQFKEGKANPRQPVEKEFLESFVITGSAPSETVVIDGWNIPSREVIETFFGESGRYWTPHAWASLLSTNQGV